MVKPDPEAYSTQFSGTENESQSQVGEAESSDSQMTEDEKWGFTDKKGGMASETKLGVIIFAIVLCGLGFYGWKTFGTKKNNDIAATAPNGEPGKGSDGTGSDNPEPAVGDPNAIPSAFGEVTPASASNEDLFTAQNEPGSDPFAAPVSTEPPDSGAARVAVDPGEFGAMLEPAGGGIASVDAGASQLDEGMAAFGGSADMQPLEPTGQTVAAGQPQEDPWAASGAAGTEADVFGPDPAVTATADVGGATVAAQPDSGADLWGSPASAAEGQPVSEQPAVAFDERVGRPDADSLGSDGFNFGPESDSQPAGGAAVIAQPADTYDPFAPGPVDATATAAPVARVDSNPFQPSETEAPSAVQPSTEVRTAPRTLTGTNQFDDTGAATTERFDRRLNGRTVAIEQPAPATSIDSGNFFDARPSTETAGAASSNTGTYEVRRGDTFWTISKRVYGTPHYYRSLAQHNAGLIPDPRTMPVGKRISTPTVRELEARYGDAMPAVASTVNARTFDVTQRKGLYLDDRDNIFYRVGRGDTLGTIAQLHLGRASRASDIQRLNRDQLPTKKAILRPGMLLAMPSDASSVNRVR